LTEEEMVGCDRRSFSAAAWKLAFGDDGFEALKLMQGQAIDHLKYLFRI
jgi:hypothetical protein